MKWKITTKTKYFSGISWVWQNMWFLILYYFFNILYSSLYLLFSHFFVVISFFYFGHRKNTFYSLKCLNWFNYNADSIIITIFYKGSFHVLIWKVFQSKCISLIKLTSTLNTSFSTKENLPLKKTFLSENNVEINDKGSVQKVHKKFFYCTDIYVSCDRFVSFVLFLWHLISS